MYTNADPGSGANVGPPANASLIGTADHRHAGADDLTAAGRDDDPEATHSVSTALPSIVVRQPAASALPRPAIPDDGQKLVLIAMTTAISLDIQ
jgi:hypothetical protein